MSNHWLRALMLSIVPLAAGCEVLPDLRLGEDVGIPPVSGSTVVSVPQDYQCGDPITDPNGKYQVTSSGTQESCTFTFRQDVTAIAASDYDKIPQLEGAQAINGVELVVEKFAISDKATGKEPEGLKDAEGKAFGVTILTEDDLARDPPFTVLVDGAPLEELKAQLQARQDIVIPLDVIVVVALDPAPPAELQIDFDAQPVITVGF